MTGRELMAELVRRGIALTLGHGGRIRYEAPKGVLSPELHGAMAAHKAELVALLEVTAYPSPADTGLDASSKPAPNGVFASSAFTAYPGTSRQGGEPGFRIVESRDDLLSAFADVLAERYPLVALDLETYGDAARTTARLRDRAGLDPVAATIRLAQFTAGGAVYVADFNKIGDRGLLQHLVEHAFLVGHNLKFEIRMLRAAGLRLPADLGYRLMDTMIASQLLAAGRREGEGHGLAAVVKRELGQELGKEEQASDWSGELTGEQLRYAADDVRFLLPLLRRLDAKLHEAGLTEAALMEYRAIPAVAWLETAGAPFDADAWTGLAVRAEERRAGIEGELNALLRAERPASMLPLEGLPPRLVNWSSPDQVRGALREREVELPSTDEGTLIANLDRDPIIPLLLEHREASKLASTYGRDFLKHPHPATGRIHPDWVQLGSDAGRMSCREPNLQQVPQTNEYRACFRAPAGRVLVKADYSQIELRIAAELARDKHLTDAFTAGVDVHALTAQQVMQRPQVTKADRQAAKAVNFGLIYGMGAAGLRRYAKNAYGVELTEEEAQEYRSRFFATYAGLHAWHRRQPAQAVVTRTIIGRRRMNIERFTEKLNSPVQGTGADMLKLAMGLAFETRATVPSALLVLAIHDELVIECAEADAPRGREWLVRCMRDAAQRFLKHVPVEVEATIGPTWGGDR